jgi:hypothetical protein
MVSRQLFGLLAIVAVWPTATSASAAAWPRLAAFTGSLLNSEVLVADRKDLQTLMAAINTHAAADTAGRPFVRVALFWRVTVLPEWLNSGHAPAELADQTARFYPSLGRSKAQWVFRDRLSGVETVRSVARTGLDVLTRYSIPTQLKESAR